MQWFRLLGGDRVVRSRSDLDEVEAAAVIDRVRGLERDLGHVIAHGQRFPAGADLVTVEWLPSWVEPAIAELDRDGSTEVTTRAAGG